MFRLALILFLFSQIIFANPILDIEIEKKVANFCLLVLAWEEGHYDHLKAINDDDVLIFMKKRYPNFVSDIIEVVKPQVIYQDHINRLFIYRQAANSCGENL